MAFANTVSYYFFEFGEELREYGFGLKDEIWVSCKVSQCNSNKVALSWIVASIPGGESGLTSVGIYIF